MKVLVCGGHDYNKYFVIYDSLDKLEITPTLIISGEARGADSWAKQWANDRNIKYKGYPADWNLYGAKAGYYRNKQMLEEGNPELVVAFPGEKGTRMMISLANNALIPVIYGGKWNDS